MTTTIAVIDLQLLLLVLMVLFGIAGRIAAERDQDLAPRQPARALARARSGPWRCGSRSSSWSWPPRSEPSLGWLVAFAIGTAELRGRGPGRLRLARPRAPRLRPPRGRARRHRGRLAPRPAALGGAGSGRALAPRHRLDARRRGLRRRPRPGRARAALGLGSRHERQVATARRPRAGPHRARRRRDRRPACVPLACRLRRQPRRVTRRRSASPSPCSASPASRASSASR